MYSIPLKVKLPTVSQNDINKYTYPRHSKSFNRFFSFLYILFATNFVKRRYILNESIFFSELYRIANSFIYSIYLCTLIPIFLTNET